MSYIQYITKGEMCWDELAVKAYGDPTNFEPIIMANRTIPITAVIPAGTKLNIPIIEQTVEGNLNSVPPWKR